MENTDWHKLEQLILYWSTELGFASTGITNIDLGEHESRLEHWLSLNHHGEMSYMARHGSMRAHPEKLHPDTLSVISVRIDYLEKTPQPESILASTDLAYVSRYALGRDYHKVIRGKLKKLVAKIDSHLVDKNFTHFSARVFTDSAPVLEKALAEKAGLGWIGKNTLLLNEKVGSWFFIGEILTNLPLPETNTPQENRCGSCHACIDICPTQAIIAPYQLDARRCISYLTIEHRGVIPLEFRAPMGNRIFGCDDCQLVCPWNRYANNHSEPDFQPRHGLDSAQLIELFKWSEQTFMKNTEGSAIRRTGYMGWLRNIAIALGNSPPDNDVISALREKKGISDMVDEHIEWAIQQQPAKAI